MWGARGPFLPAAVMVVAVVTPVVFCAKATEKRNTLAMHGLEEPFFQLCCYVSVLFWREIGFCFTYYLCT
jgi:hypothetical protein